MKNAHTVPIIAPPGVIADHESPLPQWLVVDKNSPNQQAYAAVHGWEKLEKIAATQKKVAEQASTE